MNKRNDFRVEFKNQECQLFERNTIENGKIKDISGSGLSVLLYTDPFSRFVIVRFTLSGKSFFRCAEITRKTLLSTGEYEFGLKFTSQTESEREALHSILVSYAGRTYR